MVMTANLMGCSPYLDSQKDSCECVAPGVAEEKRKAWMDDFLQRYDEDKTNDEEWKQRIREKYEGKHELMVLRLYQKYPQAIDIRDTKHGAGDGDAATKDEL